ncbi:hypothetical protein BDZ91DRAFT_443094 [Kalaharituber pfeilii]|nr:hypothetical protein BDZ91DRAFT_443094 [Kalaharituber pfeilii]
MRVLKVGSMFGGATRGYNDPDSEMHRRGPAILHCSSAGRHGRQAGRQAGRRAGGQAGGWRAGRARGERHNVSAVGPLSIAGRSCCKLWDRERDAGMDKSGSGSGSSSSRTDGPMNTSKQCGYRLWPAAMPLGRPALEGKQALGAPEIHRCILTRQEEASEQARIPTRLV